MQQDEQLCPQAEMNSLSAMAKLVLAECQDKGASQAELSASVGQGYSVAVRLGEVETVEFHRDRGITVTVYFGQQKGLASTNDTSASALQETVQAACDIAQSTQADECAGLAEASLMATEAADFDLFHPWDLSVQQAIDDAKRCEAMGREYDTRISNSDGAYISTHHGVSVYANSHGFLGMTPSSRHSLGCTLIAEQGDAMQRDYSYSVARCPSDLRSIDWVAEQAAQRTLGRLGARQIDTCQVPVLFSADIARGLLASFISAISGGRLYRQSSFLLDCLDKQVFPTHIDILEQPHLARGLGSAGFDGEGVATQGKHFVESGYLTSYVLSSYSARKLKMQTTGNAGGVFNLRVSHGDQDLSQLIKQLDRGLLVTSLMGQGINLVTGDYSRGASGYWVEQGVIQHPVDEVTIAGNLKDMFMNIVAIGNDVDYRGNMCSGSILVDAMTVAGS